MLTWLVATAFAQDSLPALNVEHYRAPIDAEATGWTDDAGDAPLGWWTGKMVVNYHHGALALVSDDGDRRLVLADALGIGLVGGVSLGHVRIGASVPVYALATGDREGGASGLGDIEVDVKATVLDPRTRQVGVAGSARLRMPTATLDAPLKAGRPSIELAGIVDRRFGDEGLVAANVGVLIGPRSEALNLAIDDAFVWRVGGGWLATAHDGLSLDVAGRVGFGVPGAHAIDAPVEVLLGGFHRTSSGAVVRLGVGTGLTRAAGSPVVRAVLSLGAEAPRVRDRDADDDGIEDKVDACPAEPEDIDDFADLDGCPDPDDDGDTIVDTLDDCRLEPEDFDGWLDDDGCPDPMTLVHVRVFDLDRRPIAGAALELSAGEDVRAGAAELSAEVEPGAWTVTATAPGFEPGTLAFEVVNGPPVEREVLLKPEMALGTLRVVVVDTDGNPVSARVSVGGNVVQLPAGGADLPVVPGKYEVAAEAGGYTGAKGQTSVKARRTAEVRLVLTSLAARVAIRVTAPDGAPASGTWIIDGHEPVPVVAGHAELELTPGEHPAVFLAEGYPTSTHVVRAERGETLTTEIQLKAVRVTISAERIDIADTVYFDTGKDTIQATSFSLLDEVAQLLIDHPELLEVRIEGHTDSRGSASSNLDLSDRRAAAVRRYLVEKGVAPDRLTSAGYGETKPLDPAETPEAWAKNRRVEFHVSRRE